MSDTAQQQIDILIQSIADAEEPASITNGMVATVLESLADRIKAAFAAQAGFLDSSDLATALATYFVNGKLSDDVLPAALVSIIASLPENYTRLGRDGKLLSSQAPVMVLASMGSNYDPPGYRYEPKNGDTYFMGSKLMYVKNEESLDMGSPSAGTVYCNAANDTLYRWNGSRFVTVSSPNSGTTSNLTAIINNIETVNSKLNALIEALANIAFKQLPKPETTELDWDGTKHTVTLNTNGMSGCSVEGTWPKQILDGMSAVITVVPENGKILRSVTYRYGNDYTWHTVVISNNQAVITIPNVTSDITVTITASATDAGSFTATINDSRVDGTGATSGITEGSSWTSVLSLNSDDPSDEITNVTVEMLGGGSISAEEVNGVWTVHTDYVTGNITITVTVEVVTKHTLAINTANMSGCHIEYNGNKMTPTNNVVTIGNITDGSNVSFRVVPNAWYALQSLSYTIGGINQQDQNIDGTGETIAINNVTSDVTVVVTATASTTNYMFKNANYHNGKLYIPMTGRDQRYPGTFANDLFVISPIIDIEGKNTLSFHIGDGNTGSVVYFNDKVSDYAGYKNITNETLSDGSGDVSNAKSIRLCIPKDPSVVYSSWVKSGDAYLFNGIDFVEESNGEYTFKINVKNGWELFNSDYIKRSQSELEEEVYLHYQVYATVSETLPPTLFFESTNATFLSKWVRVKTNDRVKFATGNSHENRSGYTKYGLCSYKKNSNGDDVFQSWQQNTNSLASDDFREVTISEVPDDGMYVCVCGPLVSDTVPVAYIEINGAIVWQSEASKQISESSEQS